MTQIYLAEDGKKRCSWCRATEQYIDYHDHEWGFPVADDFRLFEKLTLESFQSGLSWRTILAKRENFRRAFCHFDFNKVAQFTAQDVERLLGDAGIVRHRGKIEAAINNAKKACDIVEREGSLATYLWQFRPDKETGPTSDATSKESILLSKTLKKNGWKFFGPTTAYAFMQAMGMVNDHAPDCYVRERVEKVRKAFKMP